MTSTELRESPTSSTKAPHDAPRPPRKAAVVLGRDAKKEEETREERWDDLPCTD